MPTAAPSADTTRRSLSNEDVDETTPLRSSVDAPPPPSTTTPATPPPQTPPQQGLLRFLFHHLRTDPSARLCTPNPYRSFLIMLMGLIPFNRDYHFLIPPCRVPPRDCSLVTPFLRWIDVCLHVVPSDLSCSKKGKNKWFEGGVSDWCYTV